MGEDVSTHLDSTVGQQPLEDREQFKLIQRELSEEIRQSSGILRYSTALLYHFWKRNSVYSASVFNKLICDARLQSQAAEPLVPVKTTPLLIKLMANMKFLDKVRIDRKLELVPSENRGHTKIKSMMGLVDAGELSLWCNQPWYRTHRHLCKSHSNAGGQETVGWLRKAAGKSMLPRGGRTVPGGKAALNEQVIGALSCESMVQRKMQPCAERVRHTSCDALAALALASQGHVGFVEVQPGMPDYQGLINELICKKYPHVLRMLLRLKGKEAEGWNDNGRERAAPTSSEITRWLQRDGRGTPHRCAEAERAGDEETQETFFRQRDFGSERGLGLHALDALDQWDLAVGLIDPSRTREQRFERRTDTKKRELRLQRGMIAVTMDGGRKEEVLR
ncbi:hypothetical protein B0H14DRAFT_3621880 [Mycena olivaceomarginata]|nr:hypothetical protein B0H14DRAFT_3621880 [Mycena olivaceomarginata]